MKPHLKTLIVHPPAPFPHPDVGTPIRQPDGSNRFSLYFHKLEPKYDLVTYLKDPHWGCQLSRSYQNYKGKNDNLRTVLGPPPDFGGGVEVIRFRQFR